MIFPAAFQANFHAGSGRGVENHLPKIRSADHGGKLKRSIFPPIAGNGGYGRYARVEGEDEFKRISVSLSFESGGDLQGEAAALGLDVPDQLLLRRNA
jgi:hypothetical protein